MSYSAKIVEVMLASPGDVREERQVVREVLNDWNVTNSRTRKCVLMPVGWETHSAPDLAGRAQQMINDRLLAHCDLLVGIFWTRLGSPTGVAASGTVEEIEEHMQSGKPAMLYFSKAPVVPDSLDQDQYGKLKEFKAWAMTQGLVAEYESVESFRERFRRELELNLRDNAHLTQQLEMAPTEEVLAEGHTRIHLSVEAARLLKTASDSRHGMVMMMRLYDGVAVKAGDVNFVEDGAAPREEARWVAAVEELEHSGFIAATSYKREVFRVTHSGFEAASQIDGDDLDAATSGPSDT